MGRSLACRSAKEAKHPRVENIRQERRQRGSPSQIPGVLETVPKNELIKSQDGETIPGTTIVYSHN